MLKLFTRYSSVGVINTLIHWLVFAGLYACGTRQSLANILAFAVAVTFSFFVNARWTFKAEATTRRYMFYVLF
ncbi:GtrA family protein, partial [Rahnella sp. SL6]